MTKKEKIIFCKQIHAGLKQRLRGGVIVNIDEEDILIDIVNGDLRWQYRLRHKFLDKFAEINAIVADDIVHHIVRLYRMALTKQFFNIINEPNDVFFEAAS